MRQSIVKTPFHRQMLPWVFLAGFLGIAPVVLFFTAGYRLNTKKGIVEHTSTALVDSTPSGASVFLDGASTNKKTPVAFQNLLPGLHRFRLERAGYHAYEKNIEANPLRAIFLNTIHLWPDSAPLFLTSTRPESTITISRTNRTFLLQQDTTSTISELVATSLQRPQNLPSSYTTDPMLQYSPDGSQLLIQSSPWSPNLPMGVVLNSSLTTQKFPMALYRWFGTSLIGINGPIQTEITLAPSELQRTTLATSTVDTWNDYRIESSTTTKGLLTVTDGTHRAILPAGSWSFADERNHRIILRSGSDLLSVDLTTEKPTLIQAIGDHVQWMLVNNIDTALLRHRGEIWTWDVTHEPVLIERQTEPFIGATWDALGYDIFVATKTQIIAINLDDRDGYLKTPILTLDQIWSMDANADAIFVTGQKETQSGIWKFTINP